MPDEKLASRLGLSVQTVALKRRALGISPFGEHVPLAWDKASRALLGRLSDRAVAGKLGSKLSAVQSARERFGIPRWTRFDWSPARLAALGRFFDRELAARWGVSSRTVWLKRRALGIAPADPRWRKRHAREKRTGGGRRRRAYRQVPHAGVEDLHAGAPAGQADHLDLRERQLGIRVASFPSGAAGPGGMASTARKKSAGT